MNGTERRQRILELLREAEIAAYSHLTGYVYPMTEYREGKFPFPDYEFQKTAAALEFEPDIIVIMLGSNDTNAALWSDRDTFAARYGDLVDAISATGAELILCTCSAAYPIHGGYQFGVDPEALDQVCDVIRQTAADRNLPLADIAAVTADQPQWYETDGVHPNADGAAAIAVAIAAAITG